MARTLKDRITDNKLEEARRAFAGHVQSVAFHMTLSRNMIEVLHMLRDLGEIPWRRYDDPERSRINSHSVPLLRALSARGLVWHDFFHGTMAEADEAGHQWHKLTRAGELMCELLVEANLIPVALADKQKRRASR